MQSEEHHVVYVKRLKELRDAPRFQALVLCGPAAQEAVIGLIDSVMVKHRVGASMHPGGKGHLSGKGTA